MSLSEFERRAWDNRTSADRHKPEMALKVALDDIERGKVPTLKHIIVITIEGTEDGGDLVGYYNAGDLSQLATEGAMLRAVWVSKESGN